MAVVDEYHGRAPHGARGLKHISVAARASHPRSRPARGTWIETFGEIKIDKMTQSRPARGTWIETLRARSFARNCQVAPRTGHVD